MINNKQENAPGRIEEARTLFEDLMGEVKERAEVEREAERRRSPLLRFFGWLFILSCITAAAVGAYGIYHFPDAPIREKNGAYFGKHGQPYKFEDYERFVRWEQSIFAAFGVTFTLGFTFAAWDSRNRRRHNLPE